MTGGPKRCARMADECDWTHRRLFRSSPRARRFRGPRTDCFPRCPGIRGLVPPTSRTSPRRRKGLPLGQARAATRPGVVPTGENPAPPRQSPWPGNPAGKTGGQAGPRTRAMQEEDILSEFRASQACSKGISCSLGPAQRPLPPVRARADGPDARLAPGQALAASCRATCASRFPRSSPAMGGVIIGHEMGRALGVGRCFERPTGTFELRRGFRSIRAKRC
jgi:hypothetical protein